MSTKYRVIDSIMGSGKTTKIIEELRQVDPKKKRYVMITPYLLEVERITKAVPELAFVTPSDNDGSKLSSFHKLLDDGKNIVATHALFKRWSDFTLEKLNAHNYELIIDETVECTREYGSSDGEMTSGDVMMLVDSGQLVVGDDQKLTWNTKRQPGVNSVYSLLKQDCDASRLYYMASGDDKDGVMFWEFPIELLSAFESVTILTYLFGGSLMSAYLEGHGVIPKRLTIDKEHNLVPWSEELQAAAVAPIASLINVVDDEKLNDIGERKTAFSSTWFSTQNSSTLKTVSKMTYNVLQNRFKANKDTVMWSCVKAREEVLRPKGYKSGYIACNARATNEFRSRYHLAYLRNIYMTPMLFRFYKSMRGVEPSHDDYALAELLQWIFRSAIRDSKPIDLYLPSSRMRRLLRGWVSSVGSE